MIKYAKLFMVLLSAVALFACSNGESTSMSDNGSTSSIQGNAVKGPIDGARIKLFYFSDNGTQTEIIAENAPVLTSSFGSFEFKVNPDDMKNIQTPLVMMNTGGTMGGQPAPELETIISDPSVLENEGQTISRHMSTASTVAAQMLRYRARNEYRAPTAADAQDCITKVEQALDVDLEQDPADPTQAVAMLNMSVDENLDLFGTPENNDMVTEYIDYLAANLSSSSGMLDENMDNPDNPGEDVPADFSKFGRGRLSHYFPHGPARFMNLIVSVDKQSILGDGVDAATINLKLTNGWGGPSQDGTEIGLTVISGQGTLSNAYPTTTNGRAQVTFKSTTAGEVMIQASYRLNNGNSIEQEIAVQVVDTTDNAAPVANAGSDQNVSTGSLVTLNGSQSSDINNDPLTYTWTLVSTPGGSGATLSDSNAINPTFTADVDGVYVAELVVDDGALDSAPDTVTITAASTNSAPTANAGPDQNVATGSLVTLNGSASSDADSDPLTYAWTLVSKPNGSSAALSDATASNPTFTADIEGAYGLQLIVNDGTVDSAPDTVTITAATANSAPVANAGPDQNVATGSLVTLNGSASSDADSDPLTYAWTMVSRPGGSSAALSNATASKPTFTADTDGNYVVRLVVNDGSVNSAPDTVTITAATANSAPVANAGPDQNVATGSVVALNGGASSDADGDSLIYAWTLVSRPGGSGASLSNATASNPTFTADMDGNYVVRLVVNDGSVNSAPDTVTITAATANSAPVANAGPDQSVTTGSVVQLDGSGSSDADNDWLTYAWTMVSRPSGSSAGLSNANQFNPTFTADVAGTYVVRLVVNDGTVNSGPDTVSITAAASGLNGQTLFNDNCSICHGSYGLRTVTATQIQNKLPHHGVTLSTLGGTAGVQAIADWLNTLN